MHWFACLSSGYGGWRWGVSVARVPRGKVATVCETNLLPTAEAVLAPEWLPYAERLAPGDLGAGDTLPYRADDPLLEAGFEANALVDQVGLRRAVGQGDVRRLRRGNDPFGLEQSFIDSISYHSAVSAWMAAFDAP